MPQNLLRSTPRMSVVLGLQWQEAEANIRAANGPKGEPQKRQVIPAY